VLYSMALLPISLLPRYLGMTGNVYLCGALVIGVLFLYTGYCILNDRTRQRARTVLLASVFYLPVLYALMLLDRA